MKRVKSCGEICRIALFVTSGGSHRSDLKFGTQDLKWIAIAAIVILACATSASAATLRIVSYNIDDADQGNDNNITASYAGLPTVLQAIGQHHIGTNAQPIDVLGVEELNSTTLSNLVNALNSPSLYGAGTYAYDPTPDPNDGGGPDGLIYNTKTVQVVSAVAIGTANTSGAARDPMRYLLQPIGYGSNADFYMYVSHYKADSGSTNLSRRNVEATEIRQDADALGPNAHIIYSGDFNLTSGSSEPAWTTLTASGNGQAVDPTGAAGWTTGSNTWKYLYSESTNTLSARFDFQLVSNAVLTQPGLQLASDTSDPFTGNYPSSKYPYAYEVFGNNGTTALNSATNGSGNTSLSDLANASTVLNDMMEAPQFRGSDHLPVVADYNLVGVSPLPLLGDFNRDGHVDAKDIQAMQLALTNLSSYESTYSVLPADFPSFSDINGDGNFTNADLQALLNLLQAGRGSTSVPEPASQVLVALGGLMLGFVYRRTIRRCKLSS